MPSRPTRDPSSDREPTPAERAATLWVARCDAGLTASQQADFERWLAEDPRHAELFEEYDGAWALFDRARESAQPTAAKTRASTKPSSPREHRHPAFGWWIGTLLATAATLALAYTAWWRPLHFTGTAASEIGRLERMPLPDGSTIELNTNSAVSVAYSMGERRIRLERGEAHFTVAKNPDRPFVVVANGVAVRAVGTAFNVRLRSAAIEVLVTEGKVRVDDSAKGASLLPGSTERPVGGPALPSPAGTGAAAVLSAGQRVIIAAPTSGAAEMAPGTLTEVADAEMRRELAWQQHQLEFVSAPLADIVAEFNRYNQRKLVVDDERLAARRFGGAFQANDPARFVRMLRENFSVAVEERGSETVLREAP